MAFTRGPVANGDSTSSVDPLATSAFSLSAGKLLVVCVSWESTNGTPSVSDTAGNSFTPGTKVQCSGPNNKWVQMFYCLSTAANASNIVSVDLPGTSTADFAHVGASVYNPSGTASFVAEGTGSSNSATPTTSSFTAGDCAIGIMGEFCGQTGTAGSGWTIVADTPTNASHVVDRIDSPGGSITCTVNIAGCDSCIVAMSFADGGSSGTTITPNAGSLVISGSTATRSTETVRTPTAGALVLSGSAATVATGTIRTPTAGSLVISGSQPTVTTSGSGTTITPTAGSLVLSGAQPSQTLTVPSPGTGAVVISGSQPTVSQDTGRTPAAGALSLSGSQPLLLLGTVITPAAGSLVISGSQPTVSNSGATSFNITPAAGSLVLSGSTPLQAIGVTPTAGALVISGASPSLDLGKTPTAGTLTLSGSQAGVTQAANITPTAGSLVISGAQPAIQAPIDYVITPGCGSLAIAANQPQISNSTVVFLDTHDGFRKKKGKDKELERAQQFKEKQEKRRKALEAAISPPETAKEPPKEPEKPVQPSIPPPVAANAEEVTTIVQDTEAEDMEVIQAFLKQLAAEEEELIQRLLKRA